MDKSLWTISAKGVTLSFGGVDVVKGVSLQLTGGEIHAITGENGAGKSSIAKVMAGVYQPRLGSLELNGKPIKFANPGDALRHGVGLIHQEPLTFPDLNVAENIFVGHQPKKGPIVDWPGMYREAEAILKSLDLDLDPRASVGGLSVAKQQMVELASAMSHNARIWIFDETTAPLTPKEAEELFVVMRRLRDQGCAVAIVSHRLEEVFAVSDRITVLRDGSKVAELTPSTSSIAEVIQNMVGREIANERFTLDAKPPQDTMLQLETFSGVGFQDVNLTVRAGEVVGLAGLVGAGRTELARAIFGVTRPTNGRMLVNGKPEAIFSPRQAISKGIALAPEDRQHDGLLLSHSISFNATLARLSGMSRNGWLKLGKIADASDKYAKRLKLAFRSQAQPVGQLSGGNQQKVVLSKWLMTEPKLLILDEPTRGIDVGAKHEVHTLIREQVANGMAVLMISSDLPEVLALSDRIAVMRQGRIVAEFKGSTATESDVMSAAAGQEALHGL